MGDVVLSFCEVLSKDIDAGCCDKFDSLLFNLVENFVSSKPQNFKFYNLLEQILFLRTTLLDKDKISISFACKSLTSNVVKNIYLDSCKETEDCTITIENKTLLNILRLSFDNLFIDGENEFCFNTIDQLISDCYIIKLNQIKYTQLQALMSIVESFFNSIISANMALESNRLGKKLLYQNDKLNDILTYILFENQYKTLSSYVLCSIVPKFINVSFKESVLNKIWQFMSDNFKYRSLDSTLSNNLYVLCGLSNYFIPDTLNAFSIVKANYFWELVQRGIISNDPLIRKRGLYLLKRSVDSVAKLNFQIDQELFTWNSTMTDNYNNLWEKVFILFDALEETQSHLVIPVLQTILKQIEEVNIIHPSWMLTVYSRLLCHESLQVVKLGILFFLNIDFNLYVISPLKSHVIDLLFLKLNNILLFSCQTDHNKRSPVDILLECWFKNILLNVNDSGTVFHIIVNAIMKINWCTVPLFHVLYNMTQMPIAAIFDHSTLLKLSEFIKYVIQTQNVFMRGAIQCALLNIITKHTNKNIDLLTVANTLCVLKQTECLQRGLITWDTSKQWISSSLSFESEEQLIAQLLMEENNLPLESKARILVLLVDTGLVKIDYTFNKTMANYFNVLINTESRLYASIDESDRCLKLMKIIFDESKNFPFNTSIQHDALVKSLLPFVRNTFQYIWRRFNFIDTIEHFNSIDLYIKFLYDISDNGLIYISEDELELYFEAEHVTTNGQYPSIQRYFALKILLWYIHYMKNKKHIFGLDKNLKLFCLKIISEGYLIKPLPKDMSKNNEVFTRNYNVLWGSLTSDYNSTMWWILHHCIKQSWVSVNEIINYVSITDLIYMSKSSIESGGRDSLVPILNVINDVLSKASENLEIFNNPEMYTRFLEFSWKSCFELRKESLFWPVFKSWVEMSFSEYFILDKEVLTTLLKFSEEIFNQGVVVNGLANVLLTHLKHKLNTSSMALHFLETLSSALLFGPMIRKEQRIENETTELIRSLGSEYAINSLFPKDYSRSSEEVRVIAMSIIISFSGKDEELTVVMEVLQQLLIKDEELSSKRQRYFGDSLHHRLKNRIMQAILILEALLAKSSSTEAQACVVKLIKWSSCALQAESQQPSVRYQLEWLLIRSLLHCPHLIDSFWTLFSEASEERTGSVCSFISVAYHLAATLKDYKFIDRCVQEILPWCMAQQFNLRLYAQVVLQKCWQLDCQIASKYETICKSLTKSLKQGNAVRNAEKLKNEFYFTDFHPVNHFSFETIFWELPRLSNISKDEWIPVSTLEQCFAGLDSSIPILNQDNKLKLFSPATWVVKTAAEPDMSLEASAMQKKFIPWKSMFPELEGTKNSSHTQIIMVASLIDKLPNLGGLARSCEVFAAESLVVPSLEYTKDKIFSTLSMSAEKHIDIVEVKSHNLPQYMREKKDAGYTLVGAEQTAASVSLEKFTFPKKCLLLLGNEKEGIPVNLLPLLDVCVEVRQLGLVRSLNVHVTGALFLWEYTKQYLESSDSSLKCNQYNI